MSGWVAIYARPNAFRQIKTRPPAAALQGLPALALTYSIAQVALCQFRETSRPRHSPARPRRTLRPRIRCTSRWPTISPTGSTPRRTSPTMCRANARRSVWYLKTANGTWKRRTFTGQSRLNNPPITYISACDERAVSRCSVARSYSLRVTMSLTIPCDSCIGCLLRGLESCRSFGSTLILSVTN